MERSGSERRAWGRIGGYVLRSRHDPREYTARARQTFLASFEASVDPDGLLPAEEREARARALRKAHFARLAARSAESRRKKAATAVEGRRGGKEAADASGQPSTA